jgi:4-hydroxybenzoate polyprenyltransferase
MVLIKNKAKTFAELVKFEHTVFALPFAYLGAILALQGQVGQALPTFNQVFWITVAMVGARSAAMGMNRLIDHELDRANPRTAGRHLPRGLVSVREVRTFIVGAISVFVFSVYRLSPGHVVYVPVILLLMIGYSYTKRVTCLSHVVLGFVIGFAPLGGWLAVKHKMELPAVLLGLLVALWIAGFDIIYATLDYDFDKKYGLYSLPVTLGLKKALAVAAVFHVVVAALLFALRFLLGLGLWYLTGVFVTALLLYYEHTLVPPHDLSRVNTAFFNVNGLISIQLFVFTVLDIIL